jgi:hypothetical protein
MTGFAATLKIYFIGIMKTLGRLWRAVWDNLLCLDTPVDGGCTTLYGGGTTIPQWTISPHPVSLRDRFTSYKICLLVFSHFISTNFVLHSNKSK